MSYPRRILLSLKRNCITHSDAFLRMSYFKELIIAVRIMYDMKGNDMT